MNDLERLVFSCTSCGMRYAHSESLSCACGNSIFKVSGMSTTFNPIITDEDSQADPYRKKRNSPERGKQFTNPFGEGTGSEMGMGSYSGPRAPYNNDPQGGLVMPFDPENPSDSERHFMSDGSGSVGDEYPYNSSGDNMLPEDSPLLYKPKRPVPYNNMVTTRNTDPYEEVRKRRTKQL